MKDLFLHTLRKVTTDKLYYQTRFLIKHKSLVNLRNPETFSAKLIWLNLFDRNPKYNTIVDKYEVRDYIEKEIGAKYLNDVYGVYSSVDEIDLDALPDQFVIKATHGSGWIVVCEDKSKLDWETAKKEMNSWLNKNFYNLWGEWVYKDLKPRLICEKFLKNENESGLTDYKFYCFHGEIKYIQVDMDRFEKHNRSYFDLNWEKLNFELGGCPTRKEEIPKPKCFDEMVTIAQKLCVGYKFLRVDLYEVDGKVYFGELTLYSGNGMLVFNPKSFDKKIGSYLRLDESLPS